MRRVAIVGAGIAGMGCAHRLHPHCDIHLFDKNDYIGGHTNTITIQEQGRDVAIDTGFMVFTPETYPNLTRLFNDLNILTKPTDMSFSVQHQPSTIEWNGAGFNALFGQRKNLFNLKFWRFVEQLSRFSKQAPSILDNLQLAQMDLEAFCKAFNYDSDFIDLFLLPMGSAIWSTAPSKMRQFPLHTLVRFFLRHRFLGIHNHLQWYTVDGGAKVYVEKLTRPFRQNIHINNPVKFVSTEADNVKLTFENGEVSFFDKVILACHADEALRLLESPTPLQQQLLSKFSYEKNHTLLHTDSSVLPQNKACQAAWNYRLSKHNGILKASTHYWMNRLQGVSERQNYFVSLNAEGEIKPETILKEMVYHHPIFTIDAIATQKELPSINQECPNQRVYFCGSYFNYGFHEDALTSALETSRIVIEGFSV